jgi:glycosyltransferase involved in cell wall biosynthesis
MSVGETQPTISVVIASGAGGEYLFHCLNSLREQVQGKDIEVIVVDRCGEDTARRLEHEHPYIKVIRGQIGERPSIPELRRTGVLAAGGRIVAVIEEHCLAGADWMAQIRKNFSDKDAAIGGPILADNYSRIVDWVVYFSEYHNYLPPWEAGERALLNGVNIAYSRNLLIEHQDILADGYWEVVLHPLLMMEGTFRAVPEMVVYHSGLFGYGYYLSQRYLLSRVWGGTQRQKVSQSKRLIYLITAPILPFLLLFRIASCAYRSKQYVNKFVQSFLPLIPVVFAYVWGEWLGYLIGVGDALQRVE